MTKEEIDVAAAKGNKKPNIEINQLELGDLTSFFKKHLNIDLYRPKNLKFDFVILSDDKDPVYFSNGEFISMICEKIEKSGLVFYWITLDDKGNTRTNFVDWEKASSKRIKFINVEFRPRRGPIWKGEIYESFDYRNVFVPPETLGMSEDIEIPELFDKLIDHMFGDSREHFLNWLGYYYQTLEKSRTTWLCKGEQGVGKGVLNKVLELIFSKRYVYNTSSPKGLTAGFNADYRDRLFLIFDEVDFNSLPKSMGKVDGVLKKLIVEDSMNLELKGGDVILYPFETNLMFFSNKENPLEIDEGDRRFNVVSIPHKLNQTDWWIDDITDKALFKEIPGICAWLGNLTVSKSKYNFVLKNQAKAEMIEDNLSDVDVFFGKILSNDSEWFQGFPRLHEHELTGGRSISHAYNIEKNWFKKEMLHGKSVCRIGSTEMKAVFKLIFKDTLKSRDIVKHLGEVKARAYKYTDKNGATRNSTFFGVAIPWIDKVPHLKLVVEPLDVEMEEILGVVEAEENQIYTPPAPSWVSA